MKGTAVRVALESANQPQVVALIADLDAYQDTLYPPESRHALDLNALQQPNVIFAVARDAAGQAVGCGAIVLQGSQGELKRMYVQPEQRGQGCARAILGLLEATALQRGCHLVLLETGPYQPEALAFYARHGYARRGPFGGYRDDPLSVFMQKPLSLAGQAQDTMVSRRKACEQDLPFLLGLRAKTMDLHHAEAGVVMSPSEAEARVRASFEWAEVLLIGGEPAGLLKVIRDPREWRLSQFQLLPAYQGMGLGTGLLTDLLAEAQTAGVPVSLSVLKVNPAQRLYQRLGFAVISESELGLCMQTAG